MAVAAPRLAPRHWVYLDADRTHEVHAQVASSADTGYLVTTEFPMGSRDATETVTAQTPIEGEAALQRLLGELEERLAHTGKYFRTNADDLWWTPLAPAAKPVDLRAHEAPIPGMEATGGKMRFHLFHGKNEERDRLLISMPRPGMTGRHVLAEMSFRFPDLQAGDLNVLHARLAPPVLASVVAKEHVEAPRKGFLKLFEPQQFEEAYGSSWVEKTRTIFGRAAARLVGGPAPVSKAPVHAPPDRLAMIKTALSDSRVEALRARYVDPVTEAVLVEGGEHGIRRYVNKLRAKADHRQAYEISLLEATLLLEYAIPAQMWDLAHEEGAKLVRWIYGYSA